ncbi:BTB/POZ protein [Baffinella frigidus]|nr:BTB/POZ protein [Cryptophyta sp. CCMP2293]
MQATTVSADTVKFNVGGTTFEVAVSTIQSQPEGLLAKMIGGKFQSGKDDCGAYFVDRNPQIFNTVLDVHRDNRVHELPPGVTREHVVAELHFYGLNDFADAFSIGHIILIDEASEEQLVAFCKELHLDIPDTFSSEMAGSGKPLRRQLEVSKLRTLLKDNFKGAVTLDDCAKMSAGKGDAGSPARPPGSVRVKLEF